jgi:hypothetical protein
MTGTTTACGNCASLAPFHCRETARATAGSAASACCYRPLFPCTHGRKTAWPGVKCASAFRGDLAPSSQVHGRETTRPALQGTSSHGSDFALLFGIHRRKTTPCFVTGFSLVTSPAAWCGIFFIRKIKSIAAPRGTIARSNCLLPSCPCHNIPIPFPWQLKEFQPSSLNS